MLEGACLDVAMNGFWGGRYDRTFVDVRVFNPHADSNKTSSLSSTYLKHKSKKCRMYEQRVREVERALFVLIVLSITGGMGKQASVFYKRLTCLLSEKSETNYSSTMNWLRCTITFFLLHSAVQCIRGARSAFHRPDFGTHVDYVMLSNLQN